MKKLILPVLLCLSVIPLFPQSRMTFDNAINDFAKEFTSRFPSNRNIAVVAFETNNHSLMIHFIDTMVVEILKSNSNVTVVERQRVERIQGELNFSLTGLISDATAQRIGHFIGADTVIYGGVKGG